MNNPKKQRKNVSNIGTVRLEKFPHCDFEIALNADNGKNNIETAAGKAIIRNSTTKNIAKNIRFERNIIAKGIPLK